jgi:hypothetical protein
MYGKKTSGGGGGKARSEREDLEKKHREEEEEMAGNNKQVNIDVGMVLAVLCLATAIISGVAAIMNIIGASFEAIIVNVYAFIVCVALFLIDINLPILCAEYFAFITYFAGRGLTYLPLGAVVLRGSGFQAFAGWWTMSVAFLFLLLALLEHLQNGSLPNGGTIKPLYNGSGKRPSPPTAPNSARS